MAVRELEVDGVAPLVGAGIYYGAAMTEAATYRGQDVAIVDTAGGSIVSRIPVGGNTETAATTADGSFIVAAGTTSDVFIDFDAAHSIQLKTAGSSSQFILRPVVKAFDPLPAVARLVVEVAA